MNEQIVVLAGGLGTRLGQLSERCPKILQPVGSRRFIDFILEPVVRQGYDRMLFCLGHHSEQVEDHLATRYGHLKIVTHTDARPRGTAGALRAAKHLLDETFAVLLGDTFLELDLASVFAGQSATALGTMVVTSANCGVRPNVACDDGRVVRYDKTDGVAGGLTDTGVAVLRRSTFDLLDAEPDPLDLGVLFEKLAALGSLQAAVVDARFVDIGTPESYREFVARRVR